MIDSSKLASSSDMNNTTTHSTPRSRGIFGLALATAIAAMAGLGACDPEIDRSDAEIAALHADYAVDDVEFEQLASEELEVVDDADADEFPAGELGFGADAPVAASCGYAYPPRCGPRNCVAMCVTCLYDFCRANGGSCSACKAQMEDCKDDCEAGWEECPPSDPFCDFN